jgi:hypothetical protein
MEIAKIEMLNVEEVAAEASEAKVRELADLELALVGGGHAEVSPH